MLVIFQYIVPSREKYSSRRRCTEVAIAITAKAARCDDVGENYRGARFFRHNNTSTRNGMGESRGVHLDKVQLLPTHEQPVVMSDSLFYLQKSYNDKLSAFIQLNLISSMYPFFFFFFFFFDVYQLLSAYDERRRAYYVSGFLLFRRSWLECLNNGRERVLNRFFAFSTFMARVP